MNKKAVQFGAGNIGRGFLGQLFFESGYHTVFVDVVDELVEAINRRHAYPLRIVGEDSYTLTIGNVEAVHARDVEAVAQAVAEADLGATAVGVGVLPKVAPLIAAGLAERFRKPQAPPLNLIVCENLMDAERFMRDEVRRHLDSRYHSALEEHVGFVEASIGRMVPLMTEKEKAEDPLLLCVEPYCELPVDVNGFRGPIPALSHMQPRPRFVGYVERKLFVHNMSHAVAAYLGYLKGCHYIWQAIEDAAIRGAVERAMSETCRSLAAKHGIDDQELAAHATDLLQRYRNRALGDQITRIAKDPLRKLGPRDRLIGAGLLCIEQNVEPVHVALGAAAALFYDHPDDPEAQQLQTLRRLEGIEGVFSKVCRIDPDSPLGQLILRQIDRLKGGQQPLIPAAAPPS